VTSDDSVLARADKSNSAIRNPSSHTLKEDETSENPLRDTGAMRFFEESSPTASFLSQANKNIEQLKGKFHDQRLQFHAESSLSELANTFSAINFEESSDVRKNVRDFRPNNDVFFIPEIEEGSRLIQSKLPHYT
jgi:hypothetical protein